MPTRAERAERDNQIIAASYAGETATVIAEKFGLTSTRVRQIKAGAAVRITRDDRGSAGQIAQLRRAQCENLLERAIALSEDAPQEDRAAKVGAVRAALTALDRLAAWDQSMGYLPPHLQQVWVERNVDETAGAILEVLDDENVSEEIQERIINVVDGPRRT